MRIEIFTTEPSWVAASVRFFELAVNEYNHAEIALSGGSTPIPVYEAMARTARVTHGSIEVYQVDERYVAADHPDSNQRLIMKHLIAPANENPHNKKYSPFCCFSYFQTQLPIEKAVKKYERTIKNAMAPMNHTLTLSILGLGHDGHTASLFPHSPALHETKHLTAHTMTDQFAVRDRLTLTFPAIMASRYLLLLLKGKEKKAILEDLLHSNKTVDELPAKKLLAHPNLMIHFCEE